LGAEVDVFKKNHYKNTKKGHRNDIFLEKNLKIQSLKMALPLTVNCNKALTHQSTPLKFKISIKQQDTGQFLQKVEAFPG
jgi:hypothetical protein